MSAVTVRPVTSSPLEDQRRAEPERVDRPAERSASSPAADPAGRPRRRPVKAVVLLVILGVAAGAVAWRYSQTAAEGPAQLTLYGNVDVRQVNLSFKVGGRVETLGADEGDAVKAGQVIATLDRRYFEDDLRSAKAKRDQAAAELERLENGSRPEEKEQARALEAEQQATVKRAEEDYRRAETLAGRGAATKQVLDQTSAALREAQARLRSATAARELAEIGPRAEDIAAARARLDAAEAEVMASERRLADSTLVAPNDGVILTRAREQGAIVNPGEVVFTLTLSSPVWVRTYVGEPDLGSIRPGSEVAVTTDGGRRYAGHIGFVSPTAEFTPKTVETRELRTDLVYRLRVVVEDPDGGLRQGMPVTVGMPLAAPRKRTVKERLFEAVWVDRVGFGTGGKR